MAGPPFRVGRGNQRNRPGTHREEDLASTRAV